MILTPVSELVGGMIVAKDIRDQNNRLLLAQGRRLTDSFISVLHRLCVVAVYVEQEGTEDIFAEDVVSPEARVSCQMAVQQAMQRFQNQAQSKNFQMDSRNVQLATNDLVEEILSKKSSLFAMMDMRDWAGRLFQHSVNTAILAALIARQMKHSEDACKQLAMGMMFHDCGQLLLPREVFEKQGRLSEEERKIAQQHARVGFKRTLHSDMLSPLAAYIVLRHHERVDGTGYPDGLKGEQLHPLARIAAVAEAYDAMTSLRTYGRPMMPDEAMRKILTQTGTAFDREVALALVKNVAIYPTGSAVRLNTGERGIVVSSPAGQTTRPIVRLFFDPKGRRMALEDIPLAVDTSRHIVQSGMSLNEVKASAEACRW